MRMLLLTLFCSLHLLAQPPGLFQAITNNQLDALRTAASNDKQSLDARDRRGATLLMHAAVFGSIDAMKLLLDAGLPVNATSETGATALLWAACHPPQARLLIERGANVNAVSKMGRTPLMAAASCPGNLATVNLLLDKGALPNAAAPDGHNALLGAAVNGDFAIVQSLIAHGADPKARDKAGSTPLQFAAAWLNESAIRTLLAKGVDVNAANSEAGKVKNGNIQLTQLTPLILASAFGAPNILKPLLDAGANVNAADGRGMTALATAVATERQNPASIQLLLNAGADVNKKNLMGQTPLDWANIYGNPAVIAMLTKAGAKPGDPHSPPSPPRATPSPRDAVQRSVQLIQRVNKQYFQNSGCAACHHQNLSQLLYQQVRAANLPLDRDAASQTSREVYTQFQQFAEIMLQRIDLPAFDIPLYGLFGLAAEGQKPDLTIHTIIDTIAILQQPDGGWSSYGNTRPPLEESNILRAAMAVRVLQAFPIPARQPEFDARIAKAKAWLERSRPLTGSDHAWRLAGLHWVNSSAAPAAAQQLLKRQRASGGWAQNQWSAPDAYATGEALWALRESNSLHPAAPAWQRAAQFLLSTQFPDGSWYVRSRAPKFQPYFQSGFPFDHDQWISVAATCWAAAALAPLAAPSSSQRNKIYLMRIFLLTAILAGSLAAQEPGFTSLFNGKNLNGWTLVGGKGPGYVAKDGIIECPADGGGNLFTEKEYGDFVLRLDYKLSPGGNNGVGIRSPLGGDAAYQGMEIQILDDTHERYKGKIKSEQHSGSVYDVFPARTGFQKPAGEWNEYEITAKGSNIHIKVNGVTIIHCDLNDVTEEKTIKRHPGIRRASGHIGFLGHGTLVEFRNIRIKTL